MGNGVGKLTVCFSGVSPTRRRATITSSAIVSDPFDDLGHSFCYVRPDQTAAASFKSISGASVSANAATPLSTDLFYPAAAFSSSAFEGSTSFASIPLQPIPRSSSIHSGPILNSGSLDRGFMSGPLERNFLSGPLDRAMYSGPLGREDHQFRRSFSHGGLAFGRRPKNWSLIRSLKLALSKGITRGQNSIVAPIKGVGDWVVGSDKHHDKLTGAVKFSEDHHRGSLDGGDWTGTDQNIQWAQGKAGEDRVHVVVSEEHGWVFVGIYDGFNGPDAPDYLVSNLYSAVYNELKGLLWDDDDDDDDDHHRNSTGNSNTKSLDLTCDRIDESFGLTRDLSMNTTDNSSGFSHEHKKRKDTNVIPRNNYRNATTKWEENQRRWRHEWDKERFELDRKLKERFQKNGSNQNRATNHHNDVLKALASALKKTEESYFKFADELVSENPELALMGSCVLVMLMKGEDIYVMNVGDSRAVLARKKEPDLWSQDLERINEETLYDLEKIDGEDDDDAFTSSLSALQLTKDHSTSVEEEIVRIRKEHPDDTYAVTNERVKGSLKVTRAFGAGFLKQPKWNNALLEMFRIDYVGESAYINCVPSLYHHRIGPQDKFLVLSSDGLYQYFTNEEAVSEVELFISWSPEGDPAQHLVEELLFRAAKSAGMEFHELLEIRQGERRRYHDDVSIIVISLEGRIWRSGA